LGGYREPRGAGLFGQINKLQNTQPEKSIFVLDIGTLFLPA